MTSRYLNKDTELEGAFLGVFEAPEVSSANGQETEQQKAMQDIILDKIRALKKDTIEKKRKYVRDRIDILHQEFDKNVCGKLMKAR